MTTMMNISSLFQQEVLALLWFGKQFYKEGSNIVIAVITCWHCGVV
jgi:hypothetical protein